MRNRRAIKYGRTSDAGQARAVPDVGGIANTSSTCESHLAGICVGEF